MHITPSDPAFFTFFGNAVAVRGDIALIGKPQDGQLGQNAGAAYVFARQSSGWVQIEKLVAPDGLQNDRLGSSSAVAPRVLFAGALGHLHAGAAGNGAVYVFRQHGSKWVMSDELRASDGDLGDAFSAAVSGDVDIVLIGAPFDDDMGSGAGAAYVFRFNPQTGQWIQEQKLLARDGQSGDEFGYSVALDGDVALIGAQIHHVPGSDTGAAYVFRFNPVSARWTQEQILLASDGSPDDTFGYSVALSGGTALIGARGDLPRGSAYVFQRHGTQWVQTQKLVPPDSWADLFGSSVSVDSGFAIVGAPHSQPFGGFQSYGAAYVYRFDAESGQWVQHMPALLPAPGQAPPNLGWSVAIDGATVVVGAPGESAPYGQSGAAYIYNVDPDPADLNCDNAVNTLDLGMLLVNWSIPARAPGCGGASPCAADLNGDGHVNSLDLGMLLASWTL